MGTFREAAVLTFLVAYLSQILASFPLPMVFRETKKKVVSNGVCLRSCVLSSGAFVFARSRPLVLGSVVFFRLFVFASPVDNPSCVLHDLHVDLFKALLGQKILDPIQVSWVVQEIRYS
jgi:hypothetical protein